MPLNPSPMVLLAKRTAQRLNETYVPGGSSLEPDWNPALVHRVAGALVDVILEAVAEGEEIQLGKLGRFYPKVYAERMVAQNLGDGEKKAIPKRVRVEFEPTAHATAKMEDLFELVEEVAGNAAP